MAFKRLIVAGLLALWPALATAQPNVWRKYVVVDGRECGRAKHHFQQRSRQTGKRLWDAISDFRRANLTVQSVANDANETPSAFLERKHPPRGIVYRRVTPNYFVVSSFRNGLIWYDRCNFAGRIITCVLINYPATEKKKWDSVVTRISNSLASG